MKLFEQIGVTSTFGSLKKKTLFPIYLFLKRSLYRFEKHWEQVPNGDKNGTNIFKKYQKYKKEAKTKKY